MSFATIQTRVATLIKNVSGYTDNNVSEGDYRIFARGINKAAVVRRGVSSSERGSVNAGGSMTVMNTWGVNIEIWLPYRTDPKTTRSNLNTELNAISGELNKWPLLNALAGVVHHDTGTPLEPEEFDVNDGRWWRQMLLINVLEQEAVTTSE